MNPKVSVLMSVYNAEQFLDEAVRSILDQTFGDFEFIIINDGSTDKSEKIIKDYSDSRIRLISRKNKGLTFSLNQGLKLAKGEYIARQDADDISLPDRLEKEVEFLDSHPGAVLVGSNYMHIDEKGQKTGAVTNILTHPDDLKTALIICNQYGHGSVMFRRSAISKTGVYNGKVGYVEDYDLWIRMSRVGDVCNLEEPLYMWRKTAGNITNTKQHLQIQQAFALRDKAFEHFLANRAQYRLFSWHPTGRSYSYRKSILFRDFAYLYRRKNQLINSLTMSLIAIILSPRTRKNYSLFLALFNKKKIDRWEYEYL